jgi:hypothetical protein
MTAYKIAIPLYEKDSKYYLILNNEDSIEIISDKISKGCLLIYPEDFEEIKEDIKTHLRLLPTFDCDSEVNWHGIILEQRGCYNKNIYFEVCNELNLF